MPKCRSWHDTARISIAYGFWKHAAVCPCIEQEKRHTKISMNNNHIWCVYVYRWYLFMFIYQYFYIIIYLYSIEIYVKFWGHLAQWILESSAHRSATSRYSSLYEWLNPFVVGGFVFLSILCQQQKWHQSPLHRYQCDIIFGSMHLWLVNLCWASQFKTSTLPIGMSLSTRNLDHLHYGTTPWDPRLAVPSAGLRNFAIRTENSKICR